MDKKYELLPAGYNGLHQIKALRSFGAVTNGELGGFVGSERNLSHDGDAWVYGNAEVSGDARVYGNARVCDNAEVSGDARVYGNARVGGNAEVYGNAEVCEVCTKTPINVSGLHYNITVTDGHLKAGCQLHTISEWVTKQIESSYKWTANRP